MTTWIIAYNKDGNTSTLKIESAHQPDIDEAVELVTRKAEQEYAGEEIEHEHDRTWKARRPRGSPSVTA